MSRKEKSVAKAQDTKAKAPLEKRVWREILGWVWVILAFILIQGTMVQARVIPSGSMEQTLMIGDHLLVSRFGYDAGLPLTNLHVSLWRDPLRQQIIVFHPPLPGANDYIKRVIGMPGDKLEIRRGVVWINGKVLVEPYLASPMNPNESYPYQSVTVPPGHYFMMGDNRGNSLDSRFWGFVPRENIIGKPLIIYWSYDAPTSQLASSGIGLDHLKDLALNFFPKTRWERTFRIIRGYPDSNTGGK